METKFGYKEVYQVKHLRRPDLILSTENWSRQS